MPRLSPFLSLRPIFTRGSIAATSRQYFSAASYRRLRWTGDANGESGQTRDERRKKEKEKKGKSGKEREVEKTGWMRERKREREREEEREKSGI